MAELADALDSGSSEGNFMKVQVLLPAPKKRQDLMSLAVFIFFMILLQNVSAGLHHEHR